MFHPPVKVRFLGQPVAIGLEATKRLAVTVATCWVNRGVQPVKATFPTCCFALVGQMPSCFNSRYSTRFLCGWNKLFSTLQMLFPTKSLRRMGKLGRCDVKLQREHVNGLSALLGLNA